NVKVRVKADESGVDLTNAKMSINPFCEIAVEEAVRLKEKGVASEVVVVSIGTAQSQEQIRDALALGADRGILVQTEDKTYPLQVAKILKAVAESEGAELILLGKQAIDDDNNQTGQMLAALLGVGQGTFASELTVDNGTAKVVREIDGGLQTVSLPLPAVVTADLRLNEPRFRKLPNIMAAKKKPLETKTPADFGVVMSANLETIKVVPPAERKAGIKVASVDELIDKLKNEAKAIA
ncbi:MAG: electron transfer flavoprotein subunit beta/FixA family protein, partial [Moraxella sp.]|nr:electron transfer flavoprotein subunit beta/FixA family protein [Moraxella sp.]